MCQQTPEILGASESERKMLAPSSAATAESLIVASNSDDQRKYARPHVGTTWNGIQALHTAYYKRNGRKRRRARLSSRMGAWEGGGTASKGGRDGEQDGAGRRAPWEGAGLVIRRGRELLCGAADGQSSSIPHLGTHPLHNAPRTVDTRHTVYGEQS